MRSMAVLLVALLVGASAPREVQAQRYDVFAVRYGTIEDFPLRGLLPDAPEGETLDIAMAFWVIRGEGRVVLVDSGFFRESWLERYTFRDYRRPEEAIAALSITPDEVTDVVVTHAHWDHMGGIELFPEATLWIQAAEYAYYTGPAWQEDGRSGGIDPDDVRHLVDRNLQGSLRLVEGDSVEVIPGITVFTGARHTFASQYVRVQGEVPVVLASDNAYLYRALDEERASATFSPRDRPGNVDAGRRMGELAGSGGHVVPGHDPAQFQRFPEVADGVVRIAGSGSGG
jgi:glyoxylase-like metal-dependent hydrolase (beta-lactamase superfamily II)